MHFILDVRNHLAGKEVQERADLKPQNSVKSMRKPVGRAQTEVPQKTAATVL